MRDERSNESRMLSSLIPYPSSFDSLERETRLELATLALARRCSTTELLPLWSIWDSSYSDFIVKRSRFAISDFGMRISDFVLGYKRNFRVSPSASANYQKEVKLPNTKSEIRIPKSEISFPLVVPQSA